MGRDIYPPFLLQPPRPYTRNLRHTHRLPPQRQYIPYRLRRLRRRQQSAQMGDREPVATQSRRTREGRAEGPHRLRGYTGRQKFPAATGRCHGEQSLHTHRISQIFQQRKQRLHGPSLRSQGICEALVPRRLLRRKGGYKGICARQAAQHRVH